MGTHDTILELDRLCFSYPGRKRRVLDELSFSLCQGDKIGLIGPNGSGKSTLLHIIMGLLQPMSGEIRLFGNTMKAEKDFRSARQQIGFLFQNADDQLFSPTVLEDVAFGPLNLGKTPEEAREMSLQTLARLELDGFEDRITYKLSGGEKKLVSLATVLVMSPKLLILDEPTTGLDPETMERIIRILKHLSISFLVVSHQYDFLASITKDIYRVQNGGLVYDGDAASLCRNAG
ncbi:ABC transporter ATP-binding protein [Desulfonema ishimotonii]|uniref:ABC transporter ATP-binding protein n=1 Tax=Desulfonema ishimotonii TaxID=45657 RepID=A0A401FVR9_9BACT|nr:ABC transporter ATP-binding protein [Desulfonema ishimotonii]GBC61055.1 ABC transporter ATP-binding protein [Desulfonema ishimotonii]